MKPDVKERQDCNSPDITGESGLPPYPKVYLYKRIVEAKLYIDEHYLTPIDLEKIAGEASFSKFHFLRLFKKLYGKTPHQYCTTLRIARARKLLVEGGEVADICCAVGFESTSSFIRLFKRHTGTTPAEYAGAQQRQRKHIDEKPFDYVPGCFAANYGWKK